MTTAFQSNAFQNNGFQIDSGPTPTPTADNFLPQYPKGRYRKTPPGNIVFIYDKAKELPKEDAHQLLAAIDPYLDPETPEEDVRRSAAQYITDELPSVKRIDYAALKANELAHERFISAIEKIQKNLALQQAKKAAEDDELLLTAIFCCTIN